MLLDHLVQGSEQDSQLPQRLCSYSQAQTGSKVLWLFQVSVDHAPRVPLGVTVALFII